MTKIITFVTYESPWFPAGGIAAVMSKLPAATEMASGLPTVVMTPFHERSTKLASLAFEKIGVAYVAYMQTSVQVAILHSQSAPLWYFLRPVEHSSPSFAPFDGKRHPYDVPREILLRDSLFFGVATVEALRCIAKHRKIEADSVEWNLIAQDWEAATCLLAFASQSSTKGRLHLTLHNSYDEFAPVRDLAAFGIQSEACPGDTILHRSLLSVEQPVFTVSDQFADDFTQDLLQRDVMAPHLQQVLNRHRVVGVDNGPFKELAIGAEELRRAAIGDLAALQDWKRANRQKALTALDAHAASEREPIWGNKEKFRRDDSPWFVMAGRDDPRQKGYDVAAAAIEDYLKVHHGEPDCAQFLFFPIPGDEDLPGLAFLKALAEKFAEDVLAFPFIWLAGFTAALQGAAYGLMPSLYEPFGMANEFYLSGGCVGIGRATGGNLEQIVPLYASSACSRAVRERAARFHSLSSHPTGILYRERDDIASAKKDWSGINDAQYDTAGRCPSRVEQRRSFIVFQEMANELRTAIEDGIRVYRREPELYYRMLAGGITHIQRTFSWQRAGQEYARKIQL